MEEKKLIPAQIDNKNILEDFTNDFHDGVFVFMLLAGRGDANV